MGPVVVILSALAFLVAGLSMIASRPIPRAFALYNLANAIICVVLDHTVAADTWIDPFSFMDAFAFSAALSLTWDKGRRWAWFLALGLGAQIALHLARASDLIPEHGFYRPGLNVAWTVQELAILWGIYLAPVPRRGDPV